jgi:thiopeptide-type bacteriocin biosynthesis protein
MVFPREYEWDCRVPFLPRVRCGRVILRRATWRFARETIEEATSGSFSAFAERWGMPRYIDLVSNDNRLLIDTTSEICGLILRDHLRSAREIITLEEVLCTPEKAWLTDSAGLRFRAEFIASFVRTSPVERKSPTATIVAREERSRAPGSDWLYIKLYGDAHDEGRLIDSRIAPLLQRLSEVGALELWYFLRYADPRPHLRIRMKIANESRSHVITSVLDLLAGLAQDGTVDASGIATYDREVERYGGPEGMAACEAIFAADSAHVLQYVLSAQMSDLDERVAFAARSIAEMALECADAAQTFNCRSFTSERRRLSEVDRQSAREIKRLILDARIIGPELRSALRDLAARETSGRLSLPLESIFDSLVHMHANRCALSEDLERRMRALARQVLQSVAQLGAQRGGSGTSVA